MTKTKYKSTRRRSRNAEIAQVTAQIHNVINTVPVLIVLKDGSYYCGVIRDLKGQELILEGVKGETTLPRNSTKAEATISGLGGLAGLLGNSGGLGGLGGLLGGLGKAGAGAAGAGAGAGAGGFLGSLGSIGSFMKIGMGMLKFVLPLMKGFGI